MNEAKGHRQRAGKVTQKDQTPVSQHLIHRASRPFVDHRQRNKGKNTGQQIELHQVQHDKTDREQK